MQPVTYIICEINLNLVCYLHIGALVFAHMVPVAVEQRYVEPVSVGVSHQHVSRIGDIYTVRKVGDMLLTDATQEVPLIVKHHDTVTLEVADKELFTVDGEVGRFSHVVATVEPVAQVSTVGDDKDSWGHRVNGDNVTFVSHS